MTITGVSRSHDASASPSIRSLCGSPAFASSFQRRLSAVAAKRRRRTHRSLRATAGFARRRRFATRRCGSQNLQSLGKHLLAVPAIPNRNHSDLTNFVRLQTASRLPLIEFLTIRPKALRREHKSTPRAQTGLGHSGNDFLFRESSRCEFLERTRDERRTFRVRHQALARPFRRVQVLSGVKGPPAAPPLTPPPRRALHVLLETAIPLTSRRSRWLNRRRIVRSVLLHGRDSSVREKPCEYSVRTLFVSRLRSMTQGTRAARATAVVRDPPDTSSRGESDANVRGFASDKVSNP